MIEALKTEFQKPLVRYGSVAVIVLLVVREIFFPWFEWRTSTVQRLQSSADASLSGAVVESALLNLRSERGAVDQSYQSLSAMFATRTGNENIELPSEFRALLDRWSLISTRVAVSEVESRFPPIQEFAVSLELEGRPGDIFGLVASLEKQSDLSSIDRLTIYDIKPQRVKARMEIRRYVVAD